VSPHGPGQEAGRGTRAVSRYLKAAFWFSPPLPGLGRFPLNVAGVLGLLVLGFGQPAFWLAGFGLEVAYLLLLATDRRFQKVVDGAERLPPKKEEESDGARARLVSALPGAGRERLRLLEERCARLQASPHDPIVAEGNRDALKRLVWTFLKLLVAEIHLQSADREANEGGLRADIDRLTAELRSSELTSTLRASKEATLRILKQRLDNVSRRARALEQIHSDQVRIEQQVQLAVEEEGMRGEQAVISADVDLASELLEDSFGTASVDVAALDRRYGMSRHRTPSPH
jgi:hypothetical protein